MYGVQGNPRPGTVLYQRTVYPSLDCSQLFCSPVRGDLFVPRTGLQLCNWAFCVTGLVSWNCLPLHIRSTPTLLTFLNMLKTNLFSHSYFTD